MTYRNNFDHLGNPVPPVQAPWRLADFISIAFLFGVVAAFLKGALG